MSEQPTADGAIHPAKAKLRRRIRQARRAAGPAGADRAAKLAATVLDHPALAVRLTPEATVMAHVSLPHEPPTSDLRRRLRLAGLTVLLPIAEPGGALSWVRDPGDTAAAWGVPGQPASTPEAAGQPQGADRTAVVILPALAATADGRRLGQGGGYYDRFLAELPTAADGGPLLVALVGPGELLADLPTEPHDRRVDVVIVA